MERVVDLRKKIKPKKSQEAMGQPQDTQKVQAEGTDDFRGAEGSGVENKDIHWEADYFAQSSPIWQKGMVVFLSGIIIVFVLFKYGFISIVFFALLLLIFVIRLTSHQKPLLVYLKNYGIQLDRKLIPYKNIKSFWITYEPRGIKELSIEQKEWYSPYIKIPLHGQNPVRIRDFMLNYVIEKEHEDTIFDTIARKLGI